MVLTSLQITLFDLYWAKHGASDLVVGEVEAVEGLAARAVEREAMADSEADLEVRVRVAGEGLAEAAKGETGETGMAAAGTESMQH